jgi:hypothetical protein
MPQSERSDIIKQFLKWLNAKSKTGGATWQECLRQIQIEITDMGAHERTCRSYLTDLERAKLIYIDGLKFRVSETGKNWLQRKVS